MDPAGAVRYQWPVTARARIAQLAKSAAVQRALYYSGALDAYHRRRNRDRLTVIMFHRVLAPADPRWRTADPEYSLRDDLFAATLGFFKRHYHVVALDDVIAARAGGPRLPERPLLITFDDGYRSNLVEALPAAALADDLAGARAELARELGTTSRAIAYPVGRTIASYPAVRAAVAAAGYQLGFTNASGVVDVRRRAGLDRLDLARVAVDRDLTDAMFLAQLAVPGFAYTRTTGTA